MPHQLNTVLVSVEGTVTLPSGVARRVVNSFPYRAIPGTGTGVNPANLGTVFLSTVWASIRSRLHTDFVGFQTWLRDPCFETATALTAGAPASGTKTGGRLPLSQCANLICSTALRGRSFFGVRRFSPIPTSAVTKDELAGAEATAWNVVAARVAQQLVDLNGVVWQPCVWSKLLSGPFGVGYQAWVEDITTVVRNKTLGFARHRRERTVLA
jgi:hypothetical protein